MKVPLVLAVALALVITTVSANAEELTDWENAGGKATSIGIGADGTVIVVGTAPTATNPSDFGLHKWMGSGFQPFQGGGGGIRVAVDPHGNPWVINSIKDIYRWDRGWKKINGQANDIAIGANGDVWVLGTTTIGSAGDYTLHKWDGRNGFLSPSTGGGGVRIAVDPNGNPWVINSVDDIYGWDGRGWHKKGTGKAKAISIGANGFVWVIGTSEVGDHGDNLKDYSLHRWNASAGSWDLSAIVGGGVELAVNPHGLPYVLNATKDIYFGLDNRPGILHRVADGIGTGVSDFFKMLGSLNISGYWPTTPAGPLPAAVTLQWQNNTTIPLYVYKAVAPVGTAFFCNNDTSTSLSYAQTMDPGSLWSDTIPAGYRAWYKFETQQDQICGNTNQKFETEGRGYSNNAPPSIISIN